MRSTPSTDHVVVSPVDDRGVAGRLVATLTSVVLGTPSEITTAVATVLADGHLLIEDTPGVGKTLLAKALATSIGGRLGRVQGSVDLMPSDVSGVNVYDQSSGDWVFHPGPVFNDVVLVDELNRMSPRSQAALLEAMAERQVTVDGESHPLPRTFSLIATQNPLEDAGTFALSAAQLDRFTAVISLGRPGRDVERSILAGAGGPVALESTGPVITPDQLADERAAVAGVATHDRILDFVLDICDEARRVHGSTAVSARAAKSLLAVARAHAHITGRDYVRPEDVRAAAPAVLAHRLAAGRAESVTALRQKVAAVLDHVGVPPEPR